MLSAPNRLLPSATTMGQIFKLIPNGKYTYFFPIFKTFPHQTEIPHNYLNYKIC
jgi:hypothetical protein